MMTFRFAIILFALLPLTISCSSTKKSMTANKEVANTDVLSAERGETISYGSLLHSITSELDSVDITITSFGDALSEQQVLTDSLHFALKPLRIQIKAKQIRLASNGKADFASANQTLLYDSISTSTARSYEQKEENGTSIVYNTFDPMWLMALGILLIGIFLVVFIRFKVK